ncbi:hypothetical protein KR084_007758 [Drosophila pseudotakahashii]|nr:hypothetical protein KR084_007758 [Drosophila pseudotakahashii]
MMQKCSELGRNSVAWQHFVRFGQSNLKVKKGPNGHYLESRCREELKKRLPAESFEELMAWVAKWLNRLDEKNGIVRPAEEDSPQEPKDKDSVKDVHVEKEIANKAPADPSVVDLCSDEEDSTADRFSSKETLDCESVISSSSLVILDDELGEVNLKDYADHVDGKLDEASIRKRNRREEDKTPSKATKQTLMKAFLTSNDKETEKNPSPVFLRALKRLKIPASGEIPAKDVQTSSEKRSSLILRELNLEGGTNLNSSCKEQSMSEVIVVDDLSQEDKLEPLISEKSIPKPPIDEKLNVKAMKNEQTNAFINKETPACDPLKCNEIKAKPATDVEPSASKKCETEVPLGEAKENSKPSAKNEGQKPNVSKPVGVKTMPLLTGLLLADPPAPEGPTHDANVNSEVQPDPVFNQRAEPNSIRIRSDLVSSSMDGIRVRTDLLQEQVNPALPLNQLRDHVDRISPAQPSNPPGAAEKRRLPTEPTAGNQCESTLPKRPAVDNFNPAPVTTSRYPPNIPVSAAPVSTSRYRLIAPAPASIVANARYPQSSAAPNTSSYPPTAAPVCSSSYQPVIPPSSHTTSNYQSNGAPITTYNRGYPPTNPLIAPLMNNSSFPVHSGTVRYPLEIPATAGGATNKSYPTFRPVPPGPANTVWYPPPRYPSAIPGASPPVTTSYQPVCPPVSGSSSTYRGPNTVPSSTPESTVLSVYRPPKHAPVVASSYQPVMSTVVGSANTPRYRPPIPVAPAPVVASINRGIKPVAPLPVASSSYQPNSPVPLAPQAPHHNQLTGRTDLSKIMGMLGQVELFAYGQKNQEAFHLVNQLRLSIQKGAASNCQAPQRNV